MQAEPSNSATAATVCARGFSSCTIGGASAAGGQRAQAGGLARLQRGAEGDDCPRSREEANEELEEQRLVSAIAQEDARLCVEVAQRDMCLLQQLQGRGAGGT